MNLTELCRTCLNTTDTINLLQCEVNGQSFLISDMLFECTNINILLEDNLPKSVCSKCLVFLKDSYFFLLQCVESQKTLEECVEESELITNYESKLCTDIDNESIAETMTKIESYNDFNIDNIECLDNDIHDIEKCLKLMRTAQNLNTIDENKEIHYGENEMIQETILQDNRDTIKVLRENLITVDTHSSKGHEYDEDLKPYKCECGLHYCRKSDLFRHRKCKNHNNLCYSIRGQKFNQSGLSFDKINQIYEDNTEKQTCDNFLRENKGSNVVLNLRNDKFNHEGQDFEQEQNNTEIIDKTYTQTGRFPNIENSATESELSGNKNEKLLRVSKNKVASNPNREKDFVCSCGNSYYRKSELVRHKRLKHREELPGPYKYHCPKCFKYFVSENEVVQHKLYFHDRVKCTKCKTELVGTVNLKRHEVKHHSEPLECPICNKICVSMGALNQHKKTHVNVKPYLCNVCGKGFKGPTSLMEHNRVHTKERPFACRVEGCNKNFKTASEEKIHNIRHSNEMNYTCEFCGKMFPFITNLNLHRKVHTNEKPFECTICHRKFRTKSTLGDHNKTHTGERPFPCKYCDRRFALHTALRKHIRRHLNDKPHKCSYCNYASCTRDHLVIHIRTHTGERPYPCLFPGCAKAYSTNTRRKSHMKTHSKPPKMRKMKKVTNSSRQTTDVLENNESAVEYIVKKEDDSEDYIIETLDGIELDYNNIAMSKENDDDINIETYFVECTP